MKVPLSARIKIKNKEKIEEIANKIERTISETVDRVLDDYFALKQKGEAS